MKTAPSYLSNTSKELWQQLVGTRVTSPERITLLTLALETLDRLNQLRSLLSNAKLTTVTAKTGAVHLNPLVPAEIQCRAQFLDLWQRLGLQNDPPTYEYR